MLIVKKTKFIAINPHRKIPIPAKQKIQTKKIITLKITSIIRFPRIKLLQNLIKPIKQHPK
jgi:hypothetical protein